MQHSDTMYVKRLTYVEEDVVKHVTYSPVAILDPDEVVRMVLRSGLKLHRQFSDFGQTPIEQLTDAVEDIVFEFIKEE